MPIHTLLITGSSKGIGRALAQKFAHAGLNVFAVGRNQDELNSLAKSSANIKPIVADITTEQDKIIHALKDEPSLSIIHNAGISASALFGDLSEATLRSQFETNFFAPAFLTQALLSKLKGQRVLNISSGAALQGRAYKLPYCSSKAAMHRAIESWHDEFYAQDIYFANLRPGMVDTSMQEQLRTENVPSHDFYIRAQAEGQLLTPEIVAEFVAWVMLETSNEAFAQTFWNIDDPAYEHQWSSKK